MQHSVRFKIFYLFLLVSMGLLCATVFCIVSRCKNDVLILCDWGMHRIAFQALEICSKQALRPVNPSGMQHLAC